MKLIYPSAKGFSKAMEIVWNIISEGVFNLDAKGMGLMAMDPSNISMIVFEMSKDMFSEYEVAEDKKIGIDMNFFKNILKRSRAGEKLGLELKDNLLNISFVGKKSKRNFKMHLLDLASNVFKEPAIEYVNSVKIDAGALKDIIKDATIVGNYITFEMTPDSFLAYSRSDFGEVHEEFEKGEDLIEVKVEEKAKALYPIKYLEDILKSVGKGDILTINMSTNTPLKIEMTIEGAKLRYYLAPATSEE